MNYDLWKTTEPYDPFEEPSLFEEESCMMNEAYLTLLADENDPFTYFDENPEEDPFTEAESLILNPEDDAEFEADTLERLHTAIEDYLMIGTKDGLIDLIKRA